MAAGTEQPAPGLEERVAALEAAVAELRQPEPDFMAETRVEGTHPTPAVRLTHLPTGVSVRAPDRTEAVVKLRKALAGRERRQQDLEQRTAKAVPGAA